MAGQSALREYQRRHDARERAVRERWGRFAGLVLALSDDPATTRAWRTGSRGEGELAASLAKINRPDVIALHDRRVPGTKGNIDTLVVAPSGVYVVDAKRYSGELRLRDVAPFWRSRDEHLFIGGRDRSKLADGLTWQVSAVRAVLSERPDIQVTPVLCFIGVDWPLFASPEVFRSIRLEGPRSVRTLVTGRGQLDAGEVVELAMVLSHELPPYV